MSNNYGTLFLNKALAGENFNVFARYGINEESFVSAADRKHFRFIYDYYEKNGQMPSYAMMTDQFDDFLYVPDVTDRFDTLAEGIGNRKMAVEFNRLFESHKFSELQEQTKGNTGELITVLTEELDNIRLRNTNIHSHFASIKTSTGDYLNEYKKRQAGESFKTWRSFMPFVNEELNGYTSGNVYVWYGRSGRGKSVFVLREALESAQQGATVLIWSLEMTVYEVMTRIYTMLSAKLGKTTVEIDGQRHDGGFDSKALANGHLTPETEKAFMAMLDEINEHVSGNIIVRGVDDHDFHRRDVAQLNSDIEATKADVVIVDPMYYMDYETNSSKTAGGDAAATSIKLRRLAGSQRVVIHTMTQAEEDEKEDNNRGLRTLKLPKRSEVKKTKALMEDAAALFALDTDYTQRRGIIGINKGRSGGEGTTSEMTFIPSYGIVEQMQIEDDMFAEF